MEFRNAKQAAAYIRLHHSDCGIAMRRVTREPNCELIGNVDGMNIYVNEQSEYIYALTDNESQYNELRHEIIMGR